MIPQWARGVRVIKNHGARRAAGEARKALDELTVIALRGFDNRRDGCSILLLAAADGE
jgi:hypothetical protein